jgi:hypothetical protein
MAQATQPLRICGTGQPKSQCAAAQVAKAPCKRQKKNFDREDDGGIESGPGAPTVGVARVICRNKMYFYFYLTTYLL